MSRLSFTIPGDPKGKGRPRVTKAGITYTPKETVYYENLVRTCFWSQCPDAQPLQDAVRADIDVYMSIPQSASNRRKQLMSDGVIRPTKKPDLDNIVKIILDSLNKIAYHDDSAVTDCMVRKWYSEQPRVEVTLEEI